MLIKTPEHGTRYLFFLLWLFISFETFASRPEPGEAIHPVSIGADCVTTLSKPMKLVPYHDPQYRWGWALQDANDIHQPYGSRLGEIFWDIQRRDLQILYYETSYMVYGLRFGRILLREVLAREKGNFDTITAELTEISGIRYHSEEELLEIVRSTSFYKAMNFFGYGHIIEHYHIGGTDLYVVKLTKSEELVLK